VFAPEEVPPGNGPYQFEPASRPKKPFVIAGAAVVGAMLVGGGLWVALGGDDESEAEPPVTTEDPSEADVETTIPVLVESTVPATTVVVDGSIDGEFVRMDWFDAVISDADIATTLTDLGMRESDNPVATTSDVLNLCAAVPTSSPTNATVEWALDGEPVSTGAMRVLETPADGNCINNSGEPLAPGSYEASFTDDGGGETSVALFTIGSETVTQAFVNDTPTDVCTVDVGPTSAGFYQPFELASGAPLVGGDAILIDMAAVEHEARAIDCEGNALLSFFVTPEGGDTEVGLASGAVSDGAPPATTTPPTTGPPTTQAPARLSDPELVALDGLLGSLDTTIVADADVDAALGDLLATTDRPVVATTAESRTLCVVWSVDDALDAEIVWEFNTAEIARVPTSSASGRIGGCITPAEDLFDEGAYQVYVQRGSLISTVETFTVGREETQFSFVNDTGVEICAVGFSPTLTNFYTFYVFEQSDGFDESLAPGDSSTIVAPFIENDIRARDCDGTDVSEVIGISPTDQTLNLTTGEP